MRHYVQGHPWRAIVQQSMTWRGAKLTLWPPLIVPKANCSAHDLKWYWPEDVSPTSTFYVLIFATWTYKGMRSGFEDSLYTTNPNDALDQLHRRLFAHTISFAGDPDEERALLFDIFALYHKRRLVQKVQKSNDQLARNRAAKEARIEKVHAVVTEDEELSTEGLDVLGAASLARSLLEFEDGLERARLLERATVPIQGTSRRLILFSEATDAKPVGYSLDSGEKELLQWHYPQLLHGLVGCAVDGSVLCVVCSAPWCGAVIALDDDAVLYRKSWNVKKTGERRCLHRACYDRLYRALYFGAHDPLGFETGALYSLQIPK